MKISTYFNDEFQLFSVTLNENIIAHCQEIMVDPDKKMAIFYNLRNPIAILKDEAFSLFIDSLNNDTNKHIIYKDLIEEQTSKLVNLELNLENGALIRFSEIKIKDNNTVFLSRSGFLSFIFKENSAKELIEITRENYPEYLYEFDLRAYKDSFKANG